MTKEPKYKDGSWTCPKGYAFPKCPRCGHNYFEMKPRIIQGNKYPDGGLCMWCQEEQND